jgi:hypothetical protein
MHLSSKIANSTSARAFKLVADSEELEPVFLIVELRDPGQRCEQAEGSEKRLLAHGY